MTSPYPYQRTAWPARSPVSGPAAAWLRMPLDARRPARSPAIDHRRGSERSGTSPRASRAALIEAIRRWPGSVAVVAALAGVDVIARIAMTIVAMRHLTVGRPRTAHWRGGASR